MRRKLILLAPLGLTVGLTGCMTFGGSVKGNFACKAPDGVCAPTASIDDRALAMIVGATEPSGDRMVVPAGPFIAPRPVQPGFQKTALDATRTGEHVLRIVFPAQIDGAGRLHEQTAVHAVVEEGDWRQASAESLVATSREQVSATMGGETLLAAVERGDPVVTDDVQPDPDMPSVAAVSAARTRGARPVSSDPIGDIKDQVARRMAARPRKAPGATAPEPVTQPDPSRVSRSDGTTTPENAAIDTGRPIASSRIAVPARASRKGRAAIAAVAANPIVRAHLAQAEPAARLAARGEADTPNLPAVGLQEAAPLPVVHASSLPGVDE